MTESKIFIKGNVPSSKNSKVFTGKFFVWSKAAQKYVKDTKEQFQYYTKIFQDSCKNPETDMVDYPLQVSFKFIRGTRHKFDYFGPAETIQDLMTRYHWIPDDNADVIKPYFEDYEYDKENPGVIITVLH